MEYGPLVEEMQTSEQTHENVSQYHDSRPHDKNFSDDVDQDNDDNGVAFEVPFLVVTCIIGYVGNLLVFLVYSSKKYRRSSAALYILNLAVGDTMASTVVLFHVTEFYRVTWPVLWRSDVQCAIHRTFRFLGFDITVFTMVAIAVDRYFAVCHPLVFRTKIDRRRTKCVITFLWVLSIVAVSPAGFFAKAIYGTGDQGITYRGKLAWACKLMLPQTAIIHFKAIYLNLILFFVPTLITLCIYTIIIMHVWKARTSFVRARSGQNAKRDRKHWKTARTLLVVFAAHVITHGPYAVYNVLFLFGITGSVPPLVNNVGLLLPYANSFMNPIIYSFMHKNFRKSCWEMLRGNFDWRQRRRQLSNALKLRGSVQTSQMVFTVEGKLEL